MRKDKVIATITLSDVIRECIIFGVCLLAAIALNAYSITHYQTNWSELYTEFGFVVTLAFILYAARCAAKIIIRAMWWLTKKIWNKVKR